MSNSIEMSGNTANLNIMTGATNIIKEDDSGMNLFLQNDISADNQQLDENLDPNQLLGKPNAMHVKNLTLTKDDLQDAYYNGLQDNTKQIKHNKGIHSTFEIKKEHNTSYQPEESTKYKISYMDPYSIT